MNNLFFFACGLLAGLGLSMLVWAINRHTNAVTAALTKEYAAKWKWNLP